MKEYKVNEKQLKKLIKAYIILAGITMESKMNISKYDNIKDEELNIFLSLFEKED